MAHKNFFDNVKQLNDLFYNSHVYLIKNIGKDLNLDDEQVEQLIEKYTDKGVKLKCKKDKDQPTRPRSSYVLFGNDIREKLKEQNPDASNTDIMKLLAQEWNKLSVDEKKPYEEKADADKERWQEEKESYENKMASSYVGKTNKK